MHIIGLTGGIACGKSTVSTHIRSRGVTVIDADAISRSVTEPGRPGVDAVLNVFGEAYVTDGVVDRKKLAATVFADAAQRKKLESALHPIIKAEMDREIEDARASGAKAVVLDIPLLFEAGLDSVADEVWVVTASREEQISRLASRDGLSREEALARITAQMPLAEKAARADVIIENNRSLAQTIARVDELLEGRACVL